MKYLKYCLQKRMVHMVSMFTFQMAARLHILVTHLKDRPKI